VYFKIIRGGFRMGVKKALVIKGLAAASGLEEAVLAHRLMGGLDATPEAFQHLVHPESSEEHALRAYPFFLAPPLEGEAHLLGDRKDWAAEWKWDGIRMQLVRRNGVELWTRGEEPISGQFPELVRAAQALPEGTVLDGELLLWSEGHPKSFAELQTRLHRAPSPQTQFDLFETTIPIMMVYDLLESDGIDRREESWEHRRSRLEEVLRNIECDHFHLSDILDGSWDALAEQRDGARAKQTEGLMLKHRQSIYGRGRSSGRAGWFKWKLDPYTVDCVLIGAQTGSGRRADLYTDYTFAVWQDDSPDAELVTFAKAYSGLTQKEIERLDRWIRANTISQRGPFRQVKPMLVFELGFEGLRRSPRHKSGIAVRFPRILRWREDKPAQEADRVTALEVLLEPESSC
jgi:DNA ligase-1